jgi:hypothetical protein
MSEPTATHRTALSTRTAYITVGELRVFISHTLHPLNEDQDPYLALLNVYDHEGAWRRLLDELREEARVGKLRVLHPLTRGDWQFPFLGGDFERGLVLVDERLSANLADRGLSDPLFVATAWPREVPPELLTLPADERVHYIENIGCYRGSGTLQAGAVRDTLQATIARQSHGFFTFDEAAQVLADERPGTDPKRFVEKLLTACLDGELVAYDSDGTYLKLKADEQVRHHRHLLKASELDAWLRAGPGYGFPPAAAPAATVLAEDAAASLASTPEPVMRVKPPQAQEAQEAEILDVIRRLGHEPKQLPPRRAGKPWVKSEVWREIGVCQLFKSEGVFNKAWDRLRKYEISERPGL